MTVSKQAIALNENEEPPVLPQVPSSPPDLNIVVDQFVWQPSSNPLCVSSGNSDGFKTAAKVQEEQAPASCRAQTIESRLFLPPGSPQVTCKV